MIRARDLERQRGKAIASGRAHMLTDYIRAAMERATFEWLPDDCLYFATIPELPGVWASGPTQDAARADLQSTLEEWIALGLAFRDPLPPIDGHTITVELTERAS
jgi:predicted RNase H-like HicB family nuclease